MFRNEAVLWSSVLSILSGLLNVSYASLEDAKALHANLMTNYSKYVRPVEDQTKAIDIQVHLSAIAIQEFDEVLEKFSVVGVLALNWKDENMVWDAEDYGGTMSVFVGYKDVWVPEIILSNPSEKLDSFGKEWQLIRYSPDGTANWYPGDLIKSTCSIDVRYFPFDIQECDMEFYVWGYSTFEVKLNLTRSDIDTSLMAEHGSWNLIGTSAKVEEVNFISKAIFTFRLERKPQYIIFNVILPIMFLCLLNVLVFVLPAEAGERVSYAITVLLSIAVFMTIVSNTLPKTSEPLPIIAYFLMMDLIISALISLCTVLNLRLFHKKDTIPIPKKLVYIYNFLSCSCRRSGIIGPYHKDDTIENIKLNTKGNLKMPNHNQLSERGKETNVHRIETDASSLSAEEVTWQDISTMFDYILLVIFSFLTVASFAILLMITRIQ